jgi:hypothetical protein
MLLIGGRIASGCRVALLGAAAGLVLGCAGAGPGDGRAVCAAGPRSASASESLGPVADDGNAARGASLFAAQCSKCHSPQVVDRSSRLFRGYPRLDCANYLDAASDASTSRA